MFELKLFQKYLTSKKACLTGRQGYTALPILFILGVIMLYIASDVAIDIQKNLEWRQSAGQVEQAELSAASARERIILETNKHAAGYETSVENIVDFSSDSYAPKESWGDAKLISRAQLLPGSSTSWEYYTPIPGTGTGLEGIAEEDECQYWKYSAEDLADEEHWVNNPDHPCNWNKIKLNETVIIPFYNTDYDETGDTDVINNPLDLSWADFKLRVRTPCQNEEENLTDYQYCSRYELEDGGVPAIGDGQQDDVILNWMFMGSEGEYWLKPVTIPGATTVTSFIYESVINEGMALHYYGYDYGGYGEYVVLNEEATGKDESEGNPLISGFLRNEYKKYPADREIQKPFLQLSLIHKLVDKWDGSIPYLEYQIIVDKPLASEKKIYEARGYSRGKYLHGWTIRSYQTYPPPISFEKGSGL